MRKHILALTLLIALIATIGTVQAQPESETVQNPAGRTVTLPDHAVEIAPGIFSLGLARTSDGKIVEGIAAFHHRPNHSGGPGNGGNNGGTTSTCYAYMAKDAKWKSVENWVVNTSNLDGLGSAFVLNTLTDSIADWEDAADGNLDSIQGADILGSGSSTNTVLVADTISPDNVNEVYFADIEEPGAIGVTIVWGIFNGPPFARELVEWDQVYDDVDFEWTEDAELPGEETKMDFWNIAAHELGHSTGLTHPDSTCTLETMFAFAQEGEITKRDLNDGDVTGIDKLY